jgi:anti-sigma-K factor RskA
MADEHELDDAALEALATAYAVEPPARLRARVLVAARRAPARSALRPVGRWRVVGAVAAGAVVVVGALLARETRRANDLAARHAALAAANAELVARLDAQERTLASLRQTVSAQGEVLRVLAGPRTIEATLAPQPGVAGTGRVVVDATSGETAVVVSGVAPTAAGRTYELWAIRGTQAPEPAGLFTVGPEGAVAARAARVADPASVTAFAVSVEPAGGSKAPTGPIVLIGAAKG